ncbi:hypothetical protein [uncultured Campylobacter sp.]|uniref:hypothetical protein n=1 Tax=uncultured Campylobacter sp. TaxID=218934 RepID=UPI00262D4A47|nr:hypothetical protein [uncultured Campylobacter sp.]
MKSDLNGVEFDTVNLRFGIKFARKFSLALLFAASQARREFSKQICLRGTQ